MQKLYFFVYIKEFREFFIYLFFKYKYFRNELFIKIHNYKNIFKAELNETNDMFQILLKKVLIGNATNDEVEFVKKQGINISKLISSGAIVSLPGGIAIYYTLQKIGQKYFNFNIIPNKFLNKSEAENINIEFNKLYKNINNFVILKEINTGKISPLFNIEKVYIFKFKICNNIIRFKSFKDIEKNGLVYYIDKDKKISDYSLIIRKFLLSNKKYIC